MTRISIRPEVLNWVCARRLQIARFRGTHPTTSVLAAARLRELNPELEAHHVVNRLGLARQRDLAPRLQKSLGEIALYSPVAVWWLSQKLARMV